MSEKPILFSGEMIRAILAGRKTQTRRIVKVCPKKDGVFVAGRPIIPETYGKREGVIGYYPRPDGSMKGRASYVAYLLDDMGLAWRPYGGSPDVPWPKERIGEVSPYGGPGERLWVKETFRFVGPSGGAAFYAADNGSAVLDPPPGASITWTPKWRPSIFMPRWASRITLEVTDVRVERLQEITEEDARAEGAERADVDGMQRYACVSKCMRHSTAVGWYSCLWDSINGKAKGKKGAAPWTSNPFVWVVSFRRVEAQQPQGGEGA